MVQDPQQPYAAPEDKPSFGYAALGFVLPLIGFIVFLASKKQTPRKAGSAGKGGLLGCGLQSLVLVGLVLVLLPVFNKARQVGQEISRLNNSGNRVTFSSKSGAFDPELSKLKSAIIMKEDAKVKEMLEKDSSLANKKDFMGANALHSTVIGDHLEAAKLLLEHGADPNLKNDFGQSPLDQAKTFNKKELEALFEQYKDKNKTADSSSAPGTGTPAPAGKMEHPSSTGTFEVASPPGTTAPAPKAFLRPTPTPKPAAVDRDELKQLWKIGADAKHSGNHELARKTWEQGLRLDPTNQGFRDAIKQLPPAGAKKP